MRHVRLFLVLIVVAGMFQPAAASAHGGGRIQLYEEPAGPYLVTVSTWPAPARVSLVDLAVEALHQGALVPPGALQLRVTATPVNHDASPVAVPGIVETSMLGEDQLGAHVPLETEGEWLITLFLAGASGTGSVAFTLEVSQGTFLDNPLIALGLTTIPIVAVLWLLSRRRTAPAGEDAGGVGPQSPRRTGG